MQITGNVRHFHKGHRRVFGFGVNVATVERVMTDLYNLLDTVYCRRDIVVEGGGGVFDASSTHFCQIDEETV